MKIFVVMSTGWDRDPSIRFVGHDLEKAKAAAKECRVETIEVWENDSLIKEFYLHNGKWVEIECTG